MSLHEIVPEILGFDPLGVVSAPPYWTAPVLSGSLAERFSTAARGQLPRVRALSPKPLSPLTANLYSWIARFFFCLFSFHLMTA